MNIEWWHWLVAACILLSAEVFVPGASLLWLGLAAAVVGALAFLLPFLPWQLEAAIFAVLSLAIVIWWKRYRRAHPQIRDQAGSRLHRRDQALVGRVLVLVEPISNGRGRAKVGDSSWAVVGPDLPLGARVRVQNADGSTLHVVAEPDA